MIIPINENYRINSDKYQWIIQKYGGKRKNKQTGEKEDYWKNELYYTSLSSLASGLAERMLRESEAEGIAEAMEEVKMVSATLAAALRPMFKVEVEL